MKNLLLFIAILATLPIYAQEICGNGIDDDGDGLTDCADADCMDNENCENAIPCTTLSTFYQTINGFQFVEYAPVTLTPTVVNAGTDYINGIGYNVEDGFIYGIEALQISSNPNIFSTRLFQIGADGVYVDKGIVTGLPSNTASSPTSGAFGYYVGDFDLSGNLYVYSPSSTSIYSIDIDGGTGVPGNGNAIATEIPLNPSILVSIRDFTYLPSTGLLYGINGNSELLTINPSTGNVVIGESIDASCLGFYGASFADNNGILYFYCNVDGSLYSVNPTLAFDSNPSTIPTTVLLNPGLGAVTQNDGAACALSNGFEEPSDCILTPDFAIDEIGCDTYTFTGIGVGNSNTTTIVLDYHWDFGDGTTFIGQNPTHTFPGNGDYDVTMTVIGVSIETGECCCETATERISVNCGCDAIQAEFTFEEIDCNSFEFNTTALPNAGTTPFVYYWDFGDGNTSTDVNPTHDYTNDGTYTVSLTVTGIEFDSGDCCCFEMEEVVIVDCSGFPLSCGTISGIESRESRGGNTVVFSVPSASLALDAGWGGPSYLWSFECAATGDIQTFSDKTAIANLTTCDPKEGTISVTVSVTNANGESCEISYTEGYTYFSGGLAGGPLRLSPNPTSNNVTIDFSSTEVAEGAIISISVKANDGREIKAIEMANGETKTIDISGMVDGTYMVSALKGGEVLATEKLVIQKQY